MADQLMETVDIEKAIQAETNAPPGLVEVRFYTTEPLSKEDAQNIYNYLSESDVDVKKVSVNANSKLPYLSVVYNKSAPHAGISQFLPVAVIPLIAFGMIAVLVGIGIFNMSSITNNLGKLLLITFGGMVLVGLTFRKPIERVTTAYVSKK